MSEDRIEDPAITAYRRELTAAADIARGDIDEIEDHLRLLTRELRDGGLPATAAVAEAARRIGEPRELAREHARVRGPFGAQLSRTRAWSAAALLTVPYALWLASAVAYGLRPGAYLELALSGVILAGLLARLGWARALALGSLPVILLSEATRAVGAPAPMVALVAAMFACNAGAFAFLVPWRRRELTAAGLALALMGPFYAASTTEFMIQLTLHDGSLIRDPLAVVGFAGALASALGAMLRARVAAFTAVIAGLAILRSTLDLMPLNVRMDHAEMWRAQLLATQFVGVACALATAVLIWHTGRSRFGSLRELAR